MYFKLLIEFKLCKFFCFWTDRVWWWLERFSFWYKVNTVLRNCEFSTGCKPPPLVAPQHCTGSLGIVPFEPSGNIVRSHWFFMLLYVIFAVIEEMQINDAGVADVHLAFLVRNLISLFTVLGGSHWRFFPSPVPSSSACVGSDLSSAFQCI